MPVADSGAYNPPPDNNGGGKQGGKKGGGSAPAPPPSTPSPLPEYTHTNVVKLTPYTPPAPVKPAPPAIVPMSMPVTGVSGLTLSMPSIPTDFDVPKDPVQQEPKKKKSYEMTWEDYQELSDKQRAAVDFNTLLIQAREKDLNTDYDYTGEQREVYNAAVENIFGEKGGSQVYAPETVAVLRQLDYTVDADQKKGDDLDDFLGLKVLIREKDLDNFAMPTPSPIVPVSPLHNLLTSDSGGDTRAELQATLAENTATLQETMSRGAKVLQDFRSWSAAGRNEDLAYFGGEVAQVELKPGFVDSDMARYFDTAFGALADPNRDSDATWSSIKKTLHKPGEVRAFMTYADMALGQEEYAAAAESNGWMSPDEYRALLGTLTKKGDGDAG